VAVDITKIERHQQRLAQLKTERLSYDAHWQELSTYLLPRSGRFGAGRQTDRGTRKHNAIYDSTGTTAIRILAAGMMSGMTSPARPWFRLTTSDSEMMKFGPVKTWCAEVTRKMLEVFAKSNTYMALHAIYEELAVYGTACSVVMDDFTSVIHHYPSTVGEFFLASDFRGRVNTLYREFEKTVGELVGEFGYENCSATVKNAYDNKNLNTWVPIVHAIEPRAEYDNTKRDKGNMPFASCYFELGETKDGKYLRESGFKDFPALAPRWQKTGADVYGGSPGMEILGDTKQLQHQQLRKANGIDYMTKPPLQVPVNMKSSDVDTLPGGITYVDSTGQNAGIRTAFDVNLRLDHLLQDLVDVRERIRTGCYADLFLMLANNQTGQMTATEVAERHEEKLLMLGPVLERLHNELLDPLVEMTFTKMLAAGVLPPPPEELSGTELNVEFVSMLAQAQRAVGTASVDRFVGNLGAVAQFKPEVLDRFDADTWADRYSDMLGIDPELIVPLDKAAIIRKGRAEAQAQAAQQEQTNMAADTAQKLGATPTSGGNAASDILNMFSGYGSPSGVEV
jgi:hypothetical protein